MSQALIIHLLGAPYHTSAEALRQALVRRGLTEVHVLKPAMESALSRPRALQLLSAHAEELSAAHQKGARVVISPWAVRDEAHHWLTQSKDEDDGIPANFIAALDETWNPAHHLFAVLPPQTGTYAGRTLAPTTLPWDHILHAQGTAFVRLAEASRLQPELEGLAETIVAQAPTWVPSVTHVFTGVPKSGQATNLTDLPEHLATAIRVLCQAEPTPEHQRAAAVLASIQNMRQNPDGSWHIEVPSRSLYDFQALT